MPRFSEYRRVPLVFKFLAFIIDINTGIFGATSGPSWLETSYALDRKGLGCIQFIFRILVVVGFLGAVYAAFLAIHR
jgi:hypothetical protein